MNLIYLKCSEPTLKNHKVFIFKNKKRLIRSKASRLRDQFLLNPSDQMLF